MDRLARELHVLPGARHWIIDLASPLLITYMNRSWGKAVARGNAPFRFAPAEGPSFFAKAGWRAAETRERFRRMSAFVLLERA